MLFWEFCSKAAEGRPKKGRKLYYANPENLGPNQWKGFGFGRDPCLTRFKMFKDISVLSSFGASEARTSDSKAACSIKHVWEPEPCGLELYMRLPCDKEFI